MEHLLPPSLPLAGVMVLRSIRVGFDLTLPERPSYGRLRTQSRFLSMRTPWGLFYSTSRNAPSRAFSLCFPLFMVRGIDR